MLQCLLRLPYAKCGKHNYYIGVGGSCTLLTAVHELEIYKFARFVNMVRSCRRERQRETRIYLPILKCATPETNDRAGVVTVTVDVPIKPFVTINLIDVVSLYCCVGRGGWPNRGRHAVIMLPARFALHEIYYMYILCNCRDYIRNGEAQARYR